MKWSWYRLSRLEGLSEDENRVYRNFNLFTGVALLDILVVAATLYNIELVWPFYLVLSEFFLLAFVLFLHSKGFLAFSRYAAFLLILSLQVVASVTHGAAAGFELVFFAISVLPLLFFETKRHYVSLFLISVTTHFWVQYKLQSSKPLIVLDSPFPLYWNTFITSSIIFGVMFAFKRGYQKSQNSLRKRNLEITHQKEEIESINNNLERLVVQRTQKVLEHEKLFNEYANINAHKVRSPLARIMGLLNVMELEQNKEKTLQEFLPLFKENAEELNSILDEVSRSLNTINHLHEKD